MEINKECTEGDDYGKILESNLKTHITKLLKAFFVHHEGASVISLISFKLNEQSKDYFVKVNLSTSKNQVVKAENQNPLRILTSNNCCRSEDTSESSIKENNKPIKFCEFDGKNNELNNHNLNNKITIMQKNNFENEIKNIFLSNNCDSKNNTKSGRRKSKKPQRNIIENSSESFDYASKAKIQKISTSNMNFSKLNIKTEELDSHDIVNDDNKEKVDKESSNSNILALPSILALNGLSGDNSILTSALMTPSNSLTILNQNGYNILRSVSSLTVAAQSNSIPILNTYVSLSNNTTQSNVMAKNKGLVISSSNLASISINQPLSQTPNISLISTDSSASTTSTQNTLRALSTLTTSRQSVPSQVVQAHSSKVYKCRYCCKTFNRKFCRERHERLHTGIKPYTCEICNDKFIRLEDKKRHVRSSHNRRDSSMELNNGSYLSSSNSPEPLSTKI